MVLKNYLTTINLKITNITFWPFVKLLLNNRDLNDNLYKHELINNDSKICSSSELEKNLTEKWKEQQKKPKPSLMKALIWTFWWEILMLQILTFMTNIVLRIIILPYLMTYLLTYFQDFTDLTIYEAVFIGFAVIIANFSTRTHANYLNNQSYVLGLKIATTLRAFMFKNLLSPVSRTGNECIQTRSNSCINNLINGKTKSTIRDDIKANITSTNQSNNSNGNIENTAKQFIENPNQIKQSASNPNQQTIGMIVSLMTSEMNSFITLPLYVKSLWCSPLQAILITVLLYNAIGSSVGVGMGVILILLVLQILIRKQSVKLKLQKTKIQDKRIQLAGEVFKSIQSIKSHSWERLFIEKFQKIRNVELDILLNIFNLRGFCSILSLVSKKVIVLFAIISMLNFGVQITTKNLFLIISNFSILSTTLVNVFPQGISEVENSMQVIKRIESFLLMYGDCDQEKKSIIDNSKGIKKEKENQVNLNGKINHENKINGFKSNHKCLVEDKENTNIINTPKKAFKILEPGSRKQNNQFMNQVKPGNAIILNNTNVHLAEKEVLKNISLKIKNQKLTAIIGSTGSGKSSLLLTILRQHKINGGTITDITKSKSYCSQEPWLFNGTIRENIILGLPFDKNKYDQVIKSCELSKDIESFIDQDLTLIENCGKSLSGGQQARINLARSLYRNAEIYLLDDPFSSVDANVGKSIFEKGVKQYLKGKTCILVTHQIKYISEVDHVVILNNGTIEAEGSAEEILKNGKYEQFIQSKETANNLEANENYKKFVNGNNEAKSININWTKTSIEKSINELKSVNSIYNLIAYLKLQKSYWNIYLLLISFVAYQLTLTAANYYQSILVKEQELKTLNALSQKHLKEPENILDSIFSMRLFNASQTYITSVVLLILILFFLCKLFYTFSIRNSNILHFKVVKSFLRTKISFYDSHSIGDMLKIFSNDTTDVDVLLPTTLFDALQYTFEVIESLVIAIRVNASLNLILLLGVGLINRTRVAYFRMSKDLRKLQNKAYGNILMTLSSTTDGLKTIRILESEEYFYGKFTKGLDELFKIMVLDFNLKAGFWSCINNIGWAFMSIAILSCIMLKNRYFGLNSDIGLLLAQIMTVIDLMPYFLRLITDTEKYLQTFSIVNEYVNLESEFGSDIKNKSERIIKSKETTQTKIDFYNVSMSYKENEKYALRNINLSLKQGQKIGIVGRTGAGKSSIISALLKLRPITGEIAINNVNIQDIDTESLRKSITIIPQDAFLFSSTIRENLDPFNEYSNDQLIKVLKLVNLESVHLQSVVSNNGSNIFSAGQKQLFCLARAILKRSEILILDEATANVDYSTDVLIQKLIRSHVKDAIVIIIAHRINTVIDCDMIVVLDNGEVAELGCPKELYNKGGHFYDMIKKSCDSKIL